jgi:hypothetical protein
MRKAKRPDRPPPANPAGRIARRQSIAGGVSPEDRDELDSEFDAVDIDDVVRQARNGRIDIAELDAI